jgi:hypothetical protein
MVAGYYLSYFLTKKTVWSYFIFAFAASVPAVWFVLHNFYDLTVWLGGFSIKNLCHIINASILLGLTIPGFALLPSQQLRLLVPIGLIGQAGLLCLAESKLYLHTQFYSHGSYDEDAVYPNYMVVATSVFGMLLTRRFFFEKRFGPWAAWILFCLYAAKLIMLVVITRNVMWTAIVLLLAVSPPLVFYKYVCFSTRVILFTCLNTDCFKRVQAIYVLKLTDCVLLCLLQGPTKGCIPYEIMARILPLWCCRGGSLSM